MPDNWDTFEKTKQLVFAENEPPIGVDEWAVAYLKQHFDVDTIDDVHQHLVDSASVKPTEDKELPLEEIIKYAHQSYDDEIQSVLEELTTTLIEIQQIFAEKEFKLAESLDFEHGPKGRTSSFNLSLLELLAAIDPDSPTSSDTSDSAMKQVFKLEETADELELIQKIKDTVEDLEPVIKEWNEWVSDNGMSNAQQVLNELYIQSQSEVVDLSRVKADVDLWKIQEFIQKSVEGKLDIDPIYQRNDVWSNSAAVSLVHSILRGIPLPSVILWENASGHYQVIDGKQRISSILKFYGAHPSGIELLESKMPQLKDFLINKLNTPSLKLYEAMIKDTPNKDLAQVVLGHGTLTGWPKMIKIPTIGRWLSNNDYGPTGPDENSIAKKYLPFKLNQKAKNSTVPVLSQSSGKHYWQVKDIEIETSGPTISDVFQTSSSDYKIPVIKFHKETSPNQIRQVFKLYNSTGVKLNATEQNNASYQDLLSLKLVLTVCKIRPERGVELYQDVVGIDYSELKDKIDRITLLQDFGVSDTRFNQVKIISWVLSLLNQSTRRTDGKVSTPNTAKLIEAFFGNVGNSSSFLLTNFHATLDMLIAASELLNSNADQKILHALNQTARYTNKSRRQDEWDDLASVSIMVASCLVVRCVSNWKEIAEKEETIKKIKKYMSDLDLPAKQGGGKDQFKYFAGKISGFCDIFDLSKDNLDKSKFHGNNVLENFHDLA